MEALTLYLFYIAAAGGPERRVIRHYDSERECVEIMQRWKSQSRVTRAKCLTANEYNAIVGIFTTDLLDPKLRP